LIKNDEWKSAKFTGKGGQGLRKQGRLGAAPATGVRATSERRRQRWKPARPTGLQGRGGRRLISIGESGKETAVVNREGEASV